MRHQSVLTLGIFVIKKKKKKSEYLFNNKSITIPSVLSFSPLVNGPHLLLNCPSSGRWSAMSTASTPPAPTMATVICSWTESASTTTRPQVGASHSRPDMLEKWAPATVLSIAAFPLRGIDCTSCQLTTAWICIWVTVADCQGVQNKNNQCKNKNAAYNGGFVQDDVMQWWRSDKSSDRSVVCSVITSPFSIVSARLELRLRR